jgi:hypothetical protein
MNRVGKAQVEQDVIDETFKETRRFGVTLKRMLYRENVRGVNGSTVGEFGVVPANVLIINLHIHSTIRWRAVSKDIFGVGPNDNPIQIGAKTKKNMKLDLGHASGIRSSKGDGTALTSRIPMGGAIADIARLIATRSFHGIEPQGMKNLGVGRQIAFLDREAVHVLSKVLIEHGVFGLFPFGLVSLFAQVMMLQFGLFLWRSMRALRLYECRESNAVHEKIHDGNIVQGEHVQDNALQVVSFKESRCRSGKTSGSL